jgi:hypothetical protein
MTFSDFVSKYGKIPDYKSVPKDRLLEFIDSECSMMAADYPAITSWDDVPPGTRVFIRWSGGNRGVYLYVWRKIILVDGKPGSTWADPTPDLGVGRCFAAAWMDVGDYAEFP